MWADPAEMRELEADLMAALGAHEAAMKRLDRLVRRGLPGRLRARAEVQAAQMAVLRAEIALDHARRRNLTDWAF